MPSVFAKEHVEMDDHSTLGVPKSLGEEFVGADAVPPKGLAAGIAYIDPDGSVLLMRRSGAEDNFPGHWALPGGKGEPGEDAETAAAREAAEETGNEAPEGKRKLMRKVRTPGGFDFHTFSQPVDKRFWPRLNDEHDGAGWFRLDDLPQPMHPAVKETLADHFAQDDGSSGVHAACGGKGCSGCGGTGVAPKQYWPMKPKTGAPPYSGAQDDKMAFDRAPMEMLEIVGDFRHGLAYDKESVRAYSKDGHLHVEEANISKACVNPYLGREIPHNQELGLDPDKIYKLLRHPAELEKAARTFDGKPLLSEHVGVTSDSHRHDLTIGAVGTGVRYEHPYLKAPLSVWSQDDIDGVESKKKKELSSAYHYRADMTPGNYEGEDYDGVMRDIVGNHVALVKEGRAGSDVVVGDAKNPTTIEGKFDMSKKALLSHHASVARGALMVHLQPLLAQDAKIDLTTPLKGVTSKNFKEKKPEIISAIEKQAKGKLLAADASIKEGLEGLLAMIEGMPAEQGQDEEPEETDEEKAARLAAAEKDKKAEDSDMDDDDPAEDEDLTDEEKAAKKAAEEAASAKDAEMKSMVTKPAMDAAIKEAVQANQRKMEAIAAAKEHVRPRVGSLSMAFDSAADVYRKALRLAGKDPAPFAKANAETLRGVFDMLPPVKTSQQLAQDAAPRSSGSKVSIATERPTLAANLARIGIG